MAVRKENTLLGCESPVEIIKNPSGGKLQENIEMHNGENVDDAECEDQAKEQAVECIQSTTFVQNNEHQNIEGQGDPTGHS